MSVLGVKGSEMNKLLRKSVVDLLERAENDERLNLAAAQLNDLVEGVLTSDRERVGRASDWFLSQLWDPIEEEKHIADRPIGGASRGTSTTVICPHCKVTLTVSYP